MVGRTVLSFGIAALAITPTLALVHLGPRATDTSTDVPDATGWTPKPTSGPLLSGSLSGLKHMKRQFPDAPANTCGWYSADPDEPLTCSAESACAYNTEGSYFGCCATDASGNFIGSDCAYVATPPAGCVDYASAADCDEACYYSDVLCASTAPYCVSAVLQLVDNQYLTHYACLTESDQRLFILEATTTTDSSAAASSTSIQISSPAAPTRTTNIEIPNNTTPPSSSSSSGSSNGSSSGDNSSSSSNPTPSPEPHKHSHVGAIAGGVVGGLFVIAVAVVGAIFLLRNKKKQQRKSIMPEVSQM